MIGLIEFIGLGNVTNHKDGKNPSQAIILKFKPWEQREEIYRAQEQSKNGQQIGLDLTTCRVKLLSHAIEKIKGKSDIKFTFPDINCRHCLRMKNHRERYFNRYEDLENLLHCL